MSLLEFQPNGNSPLYQQIYSFLRQQILSAQLPLGTRLPPTRELAKQLGLSRNTVVAAFEQLLMEGYLEARVGAGTYVAHNLPERFLQVEKTSEKPTRGVKRGLSKRGEMLAQTPVTVRRPRIVGAFRTGLPDFRLFPFEVWAGLESKLWRKPPTGLLDYADPAGYLPLRQAIAEHLRETRGVRCEAEQVIVIQGSQQGLDLTARMLLDPGDAVWVEDPGYLGAKGAFSAAGAKLVPVPIDSEGLQVEQGQRLSPKARLAYMTPSHQYPLGLTLSLSRRLALLEWAAGAGAWILEDDYDSHYRYVGRPLASLQGLDQEERVIYLGTFSKVMMPGLRLGYMVVPPDLVEAFVAGRALLDRHPPGIEQAVLTEFIVQGHLGRHIRRTRGIYSERKDVLVSELEQHFAGQLEIVSAEAGLHLAAWMLGDDLEASQKAAQEGLEALAVSAYRINPAARGALMLGFAPLQPEEIKSAIQQLKTILKP